MKRAFALTYALLCFAATGLILYNVFSGKGDVKALHGPRLAARTGASRTAIRRPPRQLRSRDRRSFGSPPRG